MNPSVTYIAFDPGISTGYAEYDAAGELISMGIIRGSEELEEFLENYPHTPRVVIYEDYVIYNSQQLAAHKGSRVPTVEAIGRIKQAARRWKSRVEVQASRHLVIGFKWAGIRRPPESQHSNTHDLYAHAHGTYWLQKNGIRKSRLADK